MKNVIFDVDDTLYNLMEPFEKAHKELMAARTDADCEELFEASRTYSDEAFCMSREGKISEDEEFAYRVQKTYADVGVEVSKEEAKQFEERYRYYQKHIQVPEITKQILDHCKENYRIGILTNGTTKNQGKKIREAVFVLTSELMKIYFSGFSSKDSKMKKIEIALRNRQFIQFELSKLYL